MPRARTLESWIRQRLAADPPRSKSLIMTIFGDSVAPFASGIWLGELVDLLQPFGVNERLVRTSGFRLAEEGWLRPERQGRRSRYGLTAAGQVRVAHASRRIYAAAREDWNGRWTLLMLRRSQNFAAERLQLRRELEWEGFGTLAPGMFVHPCASAESVSEVLGRLGLRDSVVWLDASEVNGKSAPGAALLVNGCWPLDIVGERYETFLAAFGRVPALLKTDMDDLSAFVLQTLLLHAFRRVVLHDPRLPKPLLPEDWPGSAAYELCRSLYKQTFRQSRAFVSAHVEGIKAGKSYPPEFMARFGGLYGS